MEFVLDLRLAEEDIKYYLGKDTIDADDLERTLSELIYRYENLKNDFENLKKEKENLEEEYYDYKQYVEDNYKHITKEEQIGE